ncbi:hypothetical protein Taro_048376, partial [Colocasia esculenta]|nr:hypothetical protein [Colocasia esculenta]
MSVAKSVSDALFSPATNLSLPPFPPVDPTPTFPSPFPPVAEELAAAAAAAAAAVDSRRHRRCRHRGGDPRLLQPLWTTSSPLPCRTQSPASPCSPSTVPTSSASSPSNMDLSTGFTWEVAAGDCGGPGAVQGGGDKKFKSVRNRSLPSPISGLPLHQKGLFFT